MEVPFASRQEQIRRLFDALVDLSPAERAARLAAVAPHDPVLRREVASLLWACDDADRKLTALDRAFEITTPTLPTPDPAGTQIGSYQVLEEIGRGGMGVVYRAYDTRLDRHVALKFLPRHLGRHPHANQRLLVEARSASGLDHPNIATVHEIRETEAGQLVLVMAYYRGQTLKERITAGRLPVAEALDLGIQIARGLAAAHARGIVHCDVKPSNVLITEASLVKLVDFGIARSLDGDAAPRHDTAGTVPYMSPEQTRNDRVDARTDLWALGVVLYEALTGQRPFGATQQHGVTAAIQEDEPCPVRRLRPDVPVPLADVVHRLLQKDPEARYPTARSAEAALQAALAASPATGAPPSRRWRQLALVLLLSVLLPVGWLLFDRPLETPPSLAVMYFANQTPEEHLDQALVDMLTTNLARDGRIEVVSRQRLHDLLQQLGQEGVATTDPGLAADVARRAQVQTILTGTVVQLGSRIRINAQLIDVGTGAMLAAFQESGVRVQDIFEMVDRLTVQVRQVMNVDTETAEYVIADATTHSYPAYLQYLQGRTQMYRWNFRGAIGHFEQAIAFDSTFALARLHLGVIEGMYSFTTTGAFGLSASARRTIREAKRLAARATDLEQRYIDTYLALFDGELTRANELARALLQHYPNEKDALFITGLTYRLLGAYGKSIHAFEQALQIDPAFAACYNELASAYVRYNDPQKAISTIKEYVALQPDVPNTYDSAWEIYMQAGMPDEAMRVAQDALRHNPSWFIFHQRAGQTHLLQGRPEEARKQFHQASLINPRWQVGFLQHTGYTLVHEGRYAEAQAAFEQAVEHARPSSSPHLILPALLDLGSMLVERGRMAEAGGAFAEAVGHATSIDAALGLLTRVQTNYLLGLARVRRGGPGGAGPHADTLLALQEALPGVPYFADLQHLLEAAERVQHHDGAAARAALSEVSPATRHRASYYTWLRASGYALAGRLERAGAEYEQLGRQVVRTRYLGDAFHFFLEHSRVNYRLARLYHERGDRDRAVTYYARAMAQWRHADEDVPELQAVRHHLAQLRAAGSATRTATPGPGRRGRRGGPGS